MGKITWRERRHIPRYDDRREIRTGVVEVDPDRCTACTLCAQVCPARALLVENKRWQMREGAANECIFCGACEAICPTGAIRMGSAYEYSGYFKTVDRGPPKAPRLEEDWEVKSGGDPP